VYDEYVGAVYSVLHRLDSLMKTVAEEAVDVTQFVCLAQNAIRRRFVSDLKRTMSDALQVKKNWQQLIVQLTHERSVPWLLVQHFYASANPIDVHLCESFFFIFTVLLVLAQLGSLGQTAIKRLCVCVCAHAIDSDGSVMFWGCPSACACISTYIHTYMSVYICACVRVCLACLSSCRLLVVILL